jgi:hypothetical protein
VLGGDLLAISQASSMSRTLISAPRSPSEVRMTSWRGMSAAAAMLASTLAM